MHDFLSLSFRVEAVHSRVAELNPYVQVTMSTDVLDESTDLSFLKRYQVGLQAGLQSAKIILCYLLGMFWYPFPTIPSTEPECLSVETVVYTTSPV